MYKYICSLLILLFCASEGHAFSYNYFWCESDRVEVGDALSKVTMTCGPPDHKEKEVKSKATTNVSPLPGKGVSSGGYLEKTEIRETVLVHYFFDCGDFNYVYKLTFENSKLKEITSLSKGSARSDRNCNAQ